MAQRLNLPDTASLASPPDAQGRLHAPSAARNAEAIIQTLGKFIPDHGNALEIASGTGQHIVGYASAFPKINWQPSDVDPKRVASINSWIEASDHSNIMPPIRLDATTSGWAETVPKQDIIILVNLLHLISEPEAKTLISQVAKALNPKGIFAIYGPFLRGKGFASNGDQAFHESLIAQDPDIGYKSFQAVQNWQASAGLDDQTLVEMPANNLMLIARRS